MFPSLDFATGGGDMNLGDTSSATGGGVSGRSGNTTVIHGTVKDKSWLFSGGGQQSDKTGYYIGASVAGLVLLGAVLYTVKGGK